MTGGFRVSDHTIEQAARAEYEYDGDFVTPWADASEGIRDEYRDGMRAALAAALPSLVAEIEKRVREQIAAEIEAVGAEVNDPFRQALYRSIASIARGDAG